MGREDEQRSRREEKSTRRDLTIWIYEHVHAHVETRGEEHETGSYRVGGSRRSTSSYMGMHMYIRTYMHTCMRVYACMHINL